MNKINYKGQSKVIKSLCDITNELLDKVNGFKDTNTTYKLSLNGSVLSLTDSDGKIQSVTLPESSSGGGGTLFRYVRWNITKKKKAVDALQMAEFGFLDENYNRVMPFIASVTANYPGNPGETPPKIIDNDINTKFFCNPGNATTNQDITSTPCTIIIDLGVEMDITKFKYYWYTANDVEGRDPSSWTVSVSQDGESYTEVSNVADFIATSSRKTLAGIWEMKLP